MPLQFVKSQRGKDKLVHGGYHVHRELDDNTIWRCDNYKKVKGLCPRKVITRGDTHMMAKIRDRAENSQNSSRRIIAEELTEASNQVRASVSIGNLSRNIRRRRQVCANAPAIPQNLVNLEIPPVYQHLLNGTRFLFYDSGPGEDRTLIFSTIEDLQALVQTTCLAADGTFSVVPTLFQQLYTIHIKLDFQFIPVVYILMSSRTEDAYAASFQELANRLPGLAPTKIYTDFEVAAVNAFRRVFQGVLMKGCYFHHTQAVWRKIQQNGLSVRYNEDEDFSILLRMIPAIAFVPSGRVHEYFDLLAASLPDEAEPILSYYEATYIGQMRGNRRREPRFQLNHWNVYEESLGEEPKTTNSIEGWHRAFAGALGAVHPNIWKFIDFLRDEQALNATKRAGYASGIQNRPKKKYVNSAMRIKTLVQRFNATEPLDYLRSLAHNFNF